MSDREQLKLLNKLCKMCGQYHVIPTSMHIPDRLEESVEVEPGGFANVSQGTHEGRQVAIKVVRMYITSDLDLIRSVSVYLHRHVHPDKWVAEILPRGGCLEAPPASQYLTTTWSDIERTPVCSRFRVDGERKHQQVHQEGPGYKLH